MYFMTFDNKKDYEEVEDFINKNNIECTTSLSSCRAFALEQAASVVENNLSNYPKFYYDEDFNTKELINNIADEIQEYDAPYDNMYSYGVEVFERIIKDISEEQDA